MYFNNVGDKESNVLMRYTYDAPLKRVFILLFDQAIQQVLGCLLVTIVCCGWGMLWKNPVTVFMSTKVSIKNPHWPRNNSMMVNKKKNEMNNSMK